MKSLLNILVLLVPLASMSPAIAQDIDWRIERDLLRTTFRIETVSKSSTSVGTGFLVSKEVVIGGVTNVAKFLATNKHMLGDWNFADGTISNFFDGLDVFLYRRNQTGGSEAKPTRIQLKDSSGNLLKLKFRLHPNPKVDVALIALIPEINDWSSVDTVAFDVGFLLGFDRIARHTGVGSQVFALGYPAGVTSLRNGYPIAKAAYISSLPGEEFAVDLHVKNHTQNVVKTRVEGKLLIVDGLIVGGNSGGPVILPSEHRTRIDPVTKQFQFLTKNTENLVVGIVSASMEQTGLGIVFSSDYIRELLEDFVKELSKDTK